MDKKVSLSAHRAKAVQSNSEDNFYLAVYGSQNYGLENSESDVDTKCLALPSFEDLALNRKLKSTTLEVEGSGLCTVRDFRLDFNSFLKQNPNTLEILFTDHYLSSYLLQKEVEELRAMGEELGRYDPKATLKALYGVAFQERKEMYKTTGLHREKVGKYGYDGKCASHLMRMYCFMDNYLDGASYKDCLRRVECRHFGKEEILSTKANNFFSKELVDRNTNRLLAEMEEKLKDFLGSDSGRAPNKEVKEHLDDLTLRVLKKYYGLTY